MSGATSGDIVFSVDQNQAPERGWILKLGTSRHEFLKPDTQLFGFGSLYWGPGYWLNQWIIQLEALVSSGGAVMLPYNFSDQCTGWLKATSPDGIAVEVQAGWRLEVVGVMLVSSSLMYMIGWPLVHLLLILRRSVTRESKASCQM